MVAAQAQLRNRENQIVFGSEPGCGTLPGHNSGNRMFSLQIDDELSLRLLELADVDALYALADRNREHFRPWLADVAATTFEETTAYLRAAMQRWASGEGFYCGIVAHGVLVGGLSVRIDQAHRHASLGYMLAEDAQGRGIVSRCVRATTDRLIRDLGMQRVEIRAEPENRRSRAVAERCGFTVEGTLRQVAWLHDHFVDMCVYAVLRDEWLART